jgi:hypothetical protein
VISAHVLKERFKHTYKVSADRISHRRFNLHRRWQQVRDDVPKKPALGRLSVSELLAVGVLPGRTHEVFCIRILSRPSVLVCYLPVSVFLNRDAVQSLAIFPLIVVATKILGFGGLRTV